MILLRNDCPPHKSKASQLPLCPPSMCVYNISFSFPASPFWEVLTQNLTPATVREFILTSSSAIGYIKIRQGSLPTSQELLLSINLQRTNRMDMSKLRAKLWKIKCQMCFEECVVTEIVVKNTPFFVRRGLTLTDWRRFPSKFSFFHAIASSWHLALGLSICLPRSIHSSTLSLFPRRDGFHCFKICECIRDERERSHEGEDNFDVSGPWRKNESGWVHCMLNGF